MPLGCVRSHAGSLAGILLAWLAVDPPPISVPTLSLTSNPSARQTIIVTGANTGIGRETAQMLTHMGGEGTRVILACRSLSKAAGAVEYCLEGAPRTFRCPWFPFLCVWTPCAVAHRLLPHLVNASGRGMFMRCSCHNARLRTLAHARTHTLSSASNPATAGGVVVEARPLDLSDLASVASFAESVAKDGYQISVLVNNAGVMMCPYQTVRLACRGGWRVQKLVLMT